MYECEQENLMKNILNNSTSSNAFVSVQLQLASLRAPHAESHALELKVLPSNDVVFHQQFTAPPG